MIKIEKKFDNLREAKETAWACALMDNCNYFVWAHAHYLTFLKYTEGFVVEIEDSNLFPTHTEFVFAATPAGARQWARKKSIETLKRLAT